MGKSNQHAQACWETGRLLSSSGSDAERAADAALGSGATGANASLKSTSARTH